LEDVIKKDLKERGFSCDNIKREALNRLEWKRSMCSSVGLGRLGAAMSC